MLGKLIKEFIVAHGMRQKDIGEAIGLDAEKMYAICKGIRKIEAVEYFDICKELGVPVDYFWKILEGQTVEG